MLIKIFCLVLLVSCVKSQSTFPTLSSSAIRTTTTTAASLSTAITFGTLSTGGIGLTTTTVASTTTSTQSITLCPTGVTICQNGGQCFIRNGATVFCSCPTGFAGEFCEIRLSGVTTTTPITTTTTASNECPLAAKQNCKNGATCIFIENSFAFCVCTANFIGTDCSVPVNGGTTTTAIASTTTTTAASLVACPAGITICQNGGQCFIRNGATVFCSCPTGFIGEFCETRASVVTTTTTVATTTTTASNECPLAAKQNCKNGATCIFIENSFAFCVCTANFIGTDCSIPVNGGTTTTVATTTTTTPSSLVACPAGITICQNSGQCFIRNGAEIFCSCRPGFTGQFCEISGATTTTTAATTTTATTTTITTTAAPLVACPAGITICQNSGQCFIRNGAEIFCSCRPGFTGQFCEISGAATTTTTTTTTTAPLLTNFCDSNPCKSNGFCLRTDALGGICYCPVGYYGMYCETQSCSPNPCQNSQTCIVSAVDNAPKCLCSSAYTGTYCEERVVL